ncbi:ribosome biogenesis GTPase Der [Candidatus Chloroploca asiatica]|uniref:GTPase Der n=1 Tax=Candidatus Chloroploca asiatica TaxID=1506545 RepID=A0A2H3L9R7_9CHLR|nr:ribosome biogenesis GTPase Der [Candidatus Chloroploca asiatica]PDW00104.1 ribosome biogenesis GTPase Der [Candidatus Chloroploca asiatica]
MAKPIVAIIGRPNVGKSTFFNRLIGERRAIIEDEPGTTRDRLYGESFWNGRDFTVVDTAGLLFGRDDPDLPSEELARRTREQATLAIDQADAMIFMVDGRDGLTTADREVAEILRPMARRVVLAVNKCDSVERSLDAVEFYELNLGDPIPMSAFHSLGTGDVLDRLVELLPERPPEEETERHLRIAIVGRPNVGKSSLINRLVGTERSVVSEVPGTTRDAIDTTIIVDGEPVTLIDTAGIRRSGRIERGIEKYAVLRALRAIERCDVALLLIDAVEGVTAQDTHIAGMILDANKGVAILVNKWDAIEKDNQTFYEFEAHVREAFKFISYAPLLFISALDGQRTGRIVQLAREIQDQRLKRVPTGELNAFLRQAVLDMPPMAVQKGAHLRLYYAVQPQVEPPVFLFFANDGNLVHWSYGRYLENRLRERYGFGGTPIVIVFRSREKKDKDS